MANMKIISMFAKVMRRKKPNPKDFEAILLPVLEQVEQLRRDVDELRQRSPSSRE